MFLGSVKLSPDQFRKATKQPWALLLSMISVFGAAPMISLGIAHLLGMNGEEDRLAVLLCSTQATTLATGIVLTEIAGGYVAMAMVITVASNALSTVLTPLGFRVFGGGAEVNVNSLAMAGELALKILLPVLLAQLLRPLLGNWAERHSRRLSFICQFIILLIIYTGVSAGLDILNERPYVLLKVAMMAFVFHITLVLFNAAVFSRVSEDSMHRTAFVLCSAQKTLPAGILIWKSYFPALPLGPMVIVCYHIIQLVVDSALAPSFTKLPLIRNTSRHV
jgi:sodium/bile acid cotransporter 7